MQSVFPSAPSAVCWKYRPCFPIVCQAHGAARNKFTFLAERDAVLLETDGGVYRFPPDGALPACDWAVFMQAGRRWMGYVVELKGSDYCHAVHQLISTAKHMRDAFRVSPKAGYVVISGRHPANASPGKGAAKRKFQRVFDGALPVEVRNGGSAALVV